jgi:parallel beta-helix repeat protein
MEQYGQRGIFRNLRIYNNYNNGLWLLGGHSDAQVYNNLVYNNSGYGIYGAYGSRNKIYNNTVVGSALEGVVFLYGGSNNEVVNNIITNNGDTITDDAGGSRFSASNNLTSDPNFVNAGSGDFHLTSNSPAKDAGVSLPEVPCDFDGNKRPAGSAYDIGAYEYGGTPSSGCSKGGGGPTPTPAPTNQPPTVTITAIPATLSVAGQGTTLQWSTTNATSCTASGGWSGSQALGGTTRFTPSATTIYTLTCQGPRGSGQGSATVTVGQASSCTLYTSGSTIPQGFGVPWDVQNPSIMLLNAACTPPTVLLKAGNPNTASVLYVYKTAYTAPSGAQGWTPVDLFGSQLISGSWYKTQAQGVAQIDTATPNYYVAYTCTWTGSAWKCGCRDSACTQSYWQVQRIQQ